MTNILLEYQSLTQMDTSKLHTLMEEQKDFQRNFFDPDNMTEQEKVLFSKENVLSLHRELGEVLNEIPWKSHRANQKPCDIDHIQEELIDCVKFLLNLCIIWGMDADILFDRFTQKSKIVRERYAQDKELLSNEQKKLFSTH